MPNISWLEEQGFSIDTPDTPNAAGDYALILAARRGRDDLVRTLLERGASIAVTDPYGNNAVWAACYAESEATIRALASHGVDLDFRNPAGNTVMAYASSSGKAPIVHLLLELGADPNIQNLDEMTALDLASSLTCLKMLRSVTAR